jgi:apolipoprotein N-acyltransferase
MPPVRLAALTGAFLAGALQAASVAWPWGGQPLWWLQVLSLALFFGLLQREASPWRGALLGWLFAIAWLACTFWWLFISMHVYGGLPAVLAVAAVLGLAAFLGLYYAAAAGLFVRWRPASSWVSPALLACLWLTAELLRVTWFTGFPWGAGGYAHVDGPLAALAPWIGVHGIGLVAAAAAATLARMAGTRGFGRPGTTLAAIVVLAGAAQLAGGLLDVPAAGRLRVALLQGNIPQDEKFQPGSGIPLALGWYEVQLQRAQADLVVAPETAIPLLPKQLPDHYLPSLHAAFGSGDRAALVGMPLGSFAEGYTNSVLGWKPGDLSYRYDKHHLVPFGEFIPPFFKWFTRMMNIPLGDFNRGSVGQASFEWRGQRLAPNICYEDLFGEELGARFADAARAPTIFVNFSNIGWFGNTVAIDQHLQISRMRALEFRRPMVRATNTGATVIIDRFGAVTHSLERHTRGVLLGEVEGGAGITPYAWWVARAGLWPLWLLGLAAAAVAELRRRRLSAPSAPAGPDARP